MAASDSARWMSAAHEALWAMVYSHLCLTKGQAEALESSPSHMKAMRKQLAVHFTVEEVERLNEDAHARHRSLPLPVQKIVYARPTHLQARAISELIDIFKAKRQGHPPGPRRRTKLRNEMAAISQIRGLRQKEVADHLFPKAKDFMNSTFDYFSHHRAEIAKEKDRLRTLPADRLLAIFEQDRIELLSILVKKTRRHRVSKTK